MEVSDPNTATSVPRQRRPGGWPAARSAESVVVGVDGSPSSARALARAMRYAAEEGVSLLVLTAWPLRHRVFVREIPGHFNDARWEALEAQARVVAQALSLVSEPPAFDTALVNAPALDALLARATGTAVVVVGSDRGAGVPAGDPPTLTERLRSGAGGPVLLVPPDDEQTDS